MSMVAADVDVLENDMQPVEYTKAEANRHPPAPELMVESNLNHVRTEWNCSLSLPFSKFPWKSSFVMCPTS